MTSQTFETSENLTPFVYGGIKCGFRYDGQLGFSEKESSLVNSGNKVHSFKISATEILTAKITDQTLQGIPEAFSTLTFNVQLISAVLTKSLSFNADNMPYFLFMIIQENVSISTYLLRIKKIHSP